MLQRVKGNVSGFLISEAMIGLSLITLAISAFYFNQSCFMKNENELYLKNLQVQAVFRKSATQLSEGKKLNRIQVHSEIGEYQINVKE